MTFRTPVVFSGKGLKLPFPLDCPDGLGRSAEETVVEKDYLGMAIERRLIAGFQGP
jgi:hypothetical protein